MIKFLKTKNKMNILKEAEAKGHIKYRGTNTRKSINFLLEIMKSRK